MITKGANMNRLCSRPECGKTVYPMEELKCLDKIWHKQCFKCSVCGMTLNMKNYKGYEKMPYCEAHYPTTKATVVADTPEMRRLQENTKNQSQVKYHEEYEKSLKGKRIEIADDPEIVRNMKNMQVQSNVAYHGELDKKQNMDQHRPATENNGYPTPTAPPNAANSIGNAVTKLPAAGNNTTENSPYTQKMQQTSTLIYSSERGGRVPPPQRPVGSIADYDPINGQWGSAATGAKPFPASGAKQPPIVSASHPHPPQTQSHPQPQQQPPQQRVNPQPQQQSPVSPGRQPIGGAGRPRAASGGPVYRAMYDYTAADTDEVSFIEGDLIINAQAVDDGWMTGTVQRTGKWGMLPCNYVERV